MRAVLLALLLTSISLAGCMAGSGAAPNEVNQAGKTIGPDWSFVDTEGVERSRDSSMGSPSLLFFMATWCGSCRSNAPRLAEVQEAYADAGLDVYALSWDPQETEGDLEQWKQAHDQPWPHGIDPNSRVARTFGITQQSSYAVLDANGVLVQKLGYPGAQDVVTLEAAVDAAFAASSDDA